MAVHGQSNGTPLYKDPTQAIPDRVNDLMSRMTLDEKIGQMTLVQKDSIKIPDIAGMGIGALLSGGGGYPTPNTPEAWAAMVSGFQEAALTSRLDIPILYGVDAVHGHNNLYGTVVFPHNIGLGAANDPDLVQRIGQATAQVMIATGIYWDYAPVVAVAQDIRWGRTYEGFSENTELVSTLGIALMRGLQNSDSSRAPIVLASVKHYLADGGARWGSTRPYPWLNSPWPQNEDWFKIDQGYADIDETTLRAIHLTPYQAAIKAGAMNIMVSYSGWQSLKMHAHKYLLTDVLKTELGFSGFLVSDWLGIDQLDPDYYTCVVKAINAGLDMIMVPFDFKRFIKCMNEALERGDINSDRIDDAVRRILRVKFQLGLFEYPVTDDSHLPEVGNPEHRAVAREAVGKSLVLLKNDDHLLPLSKSLPKLLIAGQAADDIGYQCGGWSIEWMGLPGNITDGTTILQGIRQTVSATTDVEFQANAEFGEDIHAEIGIAVVGEAPYAEGMGDRSNLSLPAAHIALINRLKAHCAKVVVILISGRPMIVTEPLADWNAFVAAWLPGTEGQGVADVLFGDTKFTGRLPHTWPRDMNQVPFKQATGDPMWPFGFGLQA
ncbi:MAG TPA: glycoside hydrolase family 3 N-terminal domain-containing protein [Aggregatilineales bacterium]|nr:glycoside hydrolase family 3 N-terminal domain-containing protein [Aggregatilineales bacterium]